MTAAEPRRNANGEAAIRAWRIGTRSATRSASSASIVATGSGRSARRGPAGVRAARDVAAPLAARRRAAPRAGATGSGMVVGMGLLRVGPVAAGVRRGAARLRRATSSGATMNATPLSR